MPTTNVVFNGTSTITGPVRLAVTAAAGGAGEMVAAPGNTECFTIVNVDTAGGIEYKVWNDWKFLGKDTGATVKGNLSGGVMVRRVNDGSASVRIEVTGVGTPAPEFPSNELLGTKKLIAIGDSIIDLGDRFGSQFPNPTNINFIVVKGGPLAMPAGSCTWDWNRQEKALRWSAPTDALGPAIDISKSGMYRIYSANPAYWLDIGVIAGASMEALPSQQETTAAATGAWVKNLGGFMHMIDILTGHRFQILRNMGISGISTNEVLGPMYQQAIDSGADVIFDNTGTNDIQLRGRTGSQVASDRAACWDQAGAAGRKVIAMLLSPRWGMDASGAAPGSYGTERAKYQKAFQDHIGTANRLMIEAARTRPWVHILNAWPNLVDATQSDSRARNGYTRDGLHYSGGMAYEVALAGARILDTLFPGTWSLVNIGGGCYYDATNNRGGNLLRSNQGAFVGTGGTAQTGVTAGTGIAAGVVVSRSSGSANILATGNKVVATDGGQDWQELVISGGVTANEGILLAFQAVDGTQIAVGDTVEFVFEFQVVGSGCSGVYADIFTTGIGFHPSAYSLQQVVQGLRPDESGVVSTEPFTVPTGGVISGPRIYVTSVPGASFAIRYRNASLHKVGV